LCEFFFLLLQPIECDDQKKKTPNEPTNERWMPPHEK
jgi:hypothetical protein